MLDQYVGRIVVALTAILLPFVAAGANWTQDNLGVDIPKEDLTNFLIAVVLGTGAVVYKWLGNRGAYERAALELEKIYETGAQIVDNLAAPEPAPVADAKLTKKPTVKKSSEPGPRKTR